MMTRFRSRIWGETRSILCFIFRLMQWCLSSHRSTRPEAGGWRLCPFTKQTNVTVTLYRLPTRTSIFGIQSKPIRDWIPELPDLQRLMMPARWMGPEGGVSQRNTAHVLTNSKHWVWLTAQSNIWYAINSQKGLPTLLPHDSEEEPLLFVYFG